MPPKRTRANRCSYSEGRRRCPYDGTGDPALCDPHRLALAELAREKSPSEVITHTIRNLFSGRPVDVDATVGAVISSVENFASRRFTGSPPPIPGQPHHHQPPPPRPPRPPPPPPDPRVQAALNARIVLGFDPTQLLTEQEIGQRRRQLARRYHPDKPGGSTAKMARINDAADVLMSELANGSV